MSQGISNLKPEDPDLIGGWKLQGRIGQGGFGTIYIGTKDGLSAAIKLISRESIEDQESIPRFANEIRSLNQLNHPGIPKVIDHNLNKITPAISPFIAVTYFEGQTLQALMDMGQSITETVWLDYLKSLVEILIHCHKNGVIHRDISPSNIIITDDGPKLIDFGFSYLKGSERLSQKDVTVGTPPFRSPEHYGGEPIDAMDIFSLASVFAYIATGTYPFIAEQESRYTDKILNDAPILQGLSENQKSLLTPSFYKDHKVRPLLNDIKHGILELQSTNSLDSYKSLLKNSSKKLKSSESQNKSKQKLFQLASVVIASLIITTGIISIISNQDASTISIDEQEQNKPLDGQISDPNLEQAESQLNTDDSKTSKNVNIELEQCLNLTKTDYKSALKNCLIAAQADNGMANYQVGYIYDQFYKDPQRARPYFEKAISLGYVDGYVGLGHDLINKKKYREAIQVLLKAEKAKSRNSSNLLGVSYERLGDLDSALKYYLISSNYGDVLSTYNAAAIYYSRKQFDDAIKYFTIAANKMDPPSMYQLGIIFREIKQDKTTSCTWFKRGLDASDQRSKQAWQDFCSDDFKVSAKEAPDVKVYALDKSPFLGSSMFHFVWVGNKEKMLDFTGIQVRPKGRPEVPWIQVPHRLQNRSEGVYALVDEIFLNVATKQTNICWDFRTVKEVTDQLDTIWNYPTASSCT
jgi:serine/threonine protein kinase